MTRLALRDELLDAQLLRTVGVAPFGGADVGECLATAAQVHGTDLSSWYDAWAATARRTLDRAEAELTAGRLLSARGAFFRASSYFRTSGVMLMGAPLDPRLVESNRRQTDAFRRGAALLDEPAEVVRIAFEQTELPGYFFRAATDGTTGGAPRATIVLLGGYDGTCEELYFLTGAAALARGYNVLAFDGPGQGAALIQQGLVLRPDFDHVLSAVVDHLLLRADVDPARIAVHGLSLGGQLAPRAASGEPRLAACVADCGSFDMFQAAIERIPKPLVGGIDGSDRRSLRTAAVLERVLRFIARKPTAGWALRRGQLVHGVDGPLVYIRALHDYTLAPHAAKITCPTLVCQAEGDDISASAPQLAAALTCPHELIRFTAAEGAGDHCEAGARTLFHQRTFAWLDPILRPSEVGSTAVTA